MPRIAFDLDGTLAKMWEEYPLGGVMIFLLHKFPNWKASQWVINRFLNKLEPIMTPTVDYSILTARMFWMRDITKVWLERHGYSPRWITYVACNVHDRLQRATAKATELRDQKVKVYYEDEEGTRRYLKALVPGCEILAPEEAIERGHAIEYRKG